MKRIILLISLVIACISIFNFDTTAQCSINLVVGSTFETCAPNSLAGTTITVQATGAGCATVGTKTWTSTTSTVASVVNSGTNITNITGGAASGTTTIRYSVGGATQATITVTNHITPGVSITGSTNVCESGSPTVTLNATPGGGMWSASNGDASVTSGGVVTGVNRGTVIISYEVNPSSTPCDFYDTHAMTIDEYPVDPGIISGTLFTWPGTTTTLTSSMPTNGTWTSGTTSVATAGAGTGVITGVNPGTTTITYTRNTSCGSDNTTAVVTVNPYPTAPGGSPIRLTTATGTTEMNTAMIYATPAGSGGTSGKTFLVGFAYWDGSSTTVTVVDQATGTPYYPTLSQTPTSVPDIIIGNSNNVSNGVNRYSVAVAYQALISSVPHVIVDIFDFNMATPGLGNSGSPVAVCSLNVNSGPVHIDAIADYLSTGTTGLAYCRYAVVTWEDLSNSKVYAAEIDLRTGNGLLLATLIDDGHNPDVAGIMRNVSSTPQTHMGLITYTSAASDKILLSEWDITNSSVDVQTYTLHDPIGGPATPRIDANDNENVNTPGSDAYFKVVAAVNDGTYDQIRTYDNILPGTTGWAISNVVSMPSGMGFATPSYNHYSPSVAMAGPESSGGAKDGTVFLTTHFTEEGSGDVVFAEPSSVSAPSVLAGGAYYWVSRNTSLATMTDRVASSAPTCNYINAGTLVAWLYENSGNDDIFYKISTSATCCGFKPSEPGANAITENGWQLYPNPANSELIISNAVSAGGSYSITDMPGRVQRSGILAGSTTEVNVSRLAPGTYILKIQGMDGESVVKKFVKQ